MPHSFSGICQLCYGSNADEFFFRVQPSTDLPIYVGVCYGICFLLSGSNVDALFTYGAQFSGFAPPQAFRAYPWQACVQHGDGLMPLPGMHGVAVPYTALSRGSLILLSCSLAIPAIWWGIQL